MDMANFVRHLCSLVNTRISPKIRDSRKRAILAKMAKNGRILGRFGDPPNSMKFHKSARRRHGSPSAIPWRDLSGHEITRSPACAAMARPWILCRKSARFGTHFGAVLGVPKSDLGEANLGFWQKGGPENLKMPKKSISPEAKRSRVPELGRGSQRV